MPVHSMLGAGLSHANASTVMEYTEDEHDLAVLRVKLSNKAAATGSSSQGGPS
jgi:hypothetical protein